MVGQIIPSAYVVGADLYPGTTDLPPALDGEIYDIRQPWPWPQRWDMVHIRKLAGCLTRDEWRDLYHSSFNHIKQGGWIEQTEIDPTIEVQPNQTLAQSSTAASWGPMLIQLSEQANKPFNIEAEIPDSLRQAGFVNIHIIKTIVIDSLPSIKYIRWNTSPTNTTRRCQSANGTQTKI